MPNDNNQYRSGSTRRRVLAAMGGAGVVGLAGCVDGDGEEPADDGTGAGDDVGAGDDGGDDVSSTDPMEFIASAGANPGTFDPTIITDATSNSTVGTMAYESLIGSTFDLSEFRPELATDWEQLDELTFRFELREGVQFHNGDEFVAEDVEFSINRILGTANAGDASWIDSVDVIDDYEVEITAEEPHAPFLNDIAIIPILPHGADGISEEPGQDDHAFDEESLGTGPFELDVFEAEDRVELIPFEDHWYDGDEFPTTAPWDRVVIRIIPEQVSQEEAMAAGELDMIDNPAPFELEQWDNQTGEVVTGNSVGYDFLTFPVNEEPFTNPKFRQGITRLIPKNAVIEAVFGGNATALAGPISPGLGAYWDAEHEQELLDDYVGEDVEEAESLLEEAFEEEDLERPFEIDFITNVNRTRERWMEIIQQTMDDTEFFDANLDVRAFDDLVPFLLDPSGAAESTDVVGIGWTGGSDPDGHVADLLHSSRHVPDGFNWNLYSNDEMDALIDEGVTTVDVDERREIYKDLQELVAQDLPMANMWTGDVIDVLNPAAVESLDQWSPHPNASNRYTTLYKPHLGETVFPPQ